MRLFQAVQHLEQLDCGLYRSRDRLEADEIQVWILLAINRVPVRFPFWHVASFISELRTLPLERV